MATDRRLAVMVDASAAARADIEGRVSRMVLAEFQGFDGWYSPRLVDQVTDAVAARVTAGQLGVATLTDAYLAQVTTYVTGRYTVGASVPAALGQTLRQGPASHQEVYGRVAKEYRLARWRGADDGEALGLAMTRAQSMVSEDMGLAFQHQTREFGRKRQLVRYRRVVRPELSETGACGLCVAASDRTYHRQDLLPMHARCKCTVIPVTANTDPGSQLNEDTLGELYESAGSTQAADLKRTRVRVVQHGELGPQLRLADHGFRGPDPLVTAAA